MGSPDRSIRFQMLLQSVQSQFDELLEEVKGIQQRKHISVYEPRLEPVGDIGACSKQPKVPKTAASQLSGLTLDEYASERAGRLSMRSDIGFNLLVGQKDKIKEQIKGAIRGAAHEHDVYKSSGIAANICKSPWFRIANMALVVINLVWIGIDIDLEDSVEYHVIKHAIRGSMFAAYLGEATLRLVAFEVKWKAMHDSWYLFDICMLFLSFMEAVLTLSVAGLNHQRDDKLVMIERVCLCSQVGRIFKFVRLVPEVKTMMTCALIGFRSVSAACILVIAFVYGFAIVTRMVSEGTHVGEEFFDSTIECVFILLILGVIPESQHFLFEIKDAPWYFLVILIIFLIVVQLTVMNLLIGLLVKVVENVADAEKDAKESVFLKTTMAEAIAEVDADSNGLISEAEVAAILENPKAIDSLQQVGIDVIALVDGIELMYQVAGVKEFNIDDFVEALQQFRASTVATVRVIAELRKCLFRRVDMLEKKVMVAHSERSTERKNTQKLLATQMAVLNDIMTPKNEKAPVNLPNLKTGDNNSGANTRSYAM